jgi:protein-disulfide isomerase
MPVALLGAMVYLIVLAAIPSPRRPHRLWHRRTADPALLIATALAGLAGPWFVLIQIAAVGALCKFCLAIHVCGIACAAIVWSHAGRRQRRLLPWAGIGLAVLMVGQMLPAPHPYAVQAGVVGDADRVQTPSAPAPTAASTTPSESRHERFVAGDRLFDLDPATLPVLGSPEAKHFIVVMSDYTCEHCRVTHRMLERWLPSFHDEVGVIVLPTLLDPASNPYLPPGVTHPMPQDAALTRLALAVYCAKPQAFGEMNRWLFARDRVRGEYEARAYATKLIGAEALQRAERDPRIGQIILTGCDLFARTGNGAIPKMLIGSTMISGPVEDGEVLLDPIRREWGGGLTSSAGGTRTRE